MSYKNYTNKSEKLKCAVLLEKLENSLFQVISNGCDDTFLCAVISDLYFFDDILKIEGLIFLSDWLPGNQMDIQDHYVQQYRNA